MDFITNLPESMSSGYTRMLLIVDCLTKIAIHLPCRKKIDCPELAQMIFDHVICKGGVADNINTDHGTEFTS